MQVTIDRLGHRGDGIAPGPVFAARTLPGEVVEGTADGDRIASPRIVTPSPDRVRAHCPHYAACGGCAVMHASDRFVAAWKAGQVTAALAAHGIRAEISGIATSPPRSRRRAALSGRRTKKGATIGFHARASDALTEIRDCHVLRPEIVGALPDLEALVVAGASRKAELTLQVTHGPAGLDIAANGGKPLDQELETVLAEIAGAADFARLTWSGTPVAMARPPYQSFAGVSVVPPPGAFLQATAEGETALRAAVTDTLGGASRVVDLFAGSGTFALPAARRAEVHAVEGDADLTAALDRARRHARGLNAATVETRDLFRNPLDAADLSRFDAAIIDPPRAGAEAQMHAIAASDIARVAAVSCNPQSFARDAAILLGAGFGLGPIRVVDQFRWSTHVELVADFRRL